MKKRKNNEKIYATVALSTTDKAPYRNIAVIKRWQQ
jgi:hypothetical protein